MTLAANSRLRTVATSLLVAAASVISDRPLEESVDLELVPVLLSNLTGKQIAALEERAAHVRDLLAAAQDEGQLKRRYAAKAQELGLSVRTLERWVASYRDSGVAGLADSRLLGRYTSAVDPRWDAACLQVLQNLTDASTPTMSVVLARVARELAAVHGPDVVPLPSRTAGYRRLQQLAKGRHAFGSAKARRSVAARPQGVYGRLRAERPGEYVVLNSTPLDVFAMEPVTLRWLPVELTVAMDLFTRCILGLRLTPVSTSSRDVANVRCGTRSWQLRCGTPPAARVEQCSGGSCCATRQPVDLQRHPVAGWTASCDGGQISRRISTRRWPCTTAYRISPAPSP